MDKLKSLQERYDKVAGEMDELLEDIEYAGCVVSDGVVKKNEFSWVVLSDWKYFDRWDPEKGSLIKRYKKATKIRKDHIEEIRKVIDSITEDMGHEDFLITMELDLGGVTLKEILNIEDFDGAIKAIANLKETQKNVFKYLSPTTENWTFGMLDIREMKIVEIDQFPFMVAQEEWS